MINTCLAATSPQAHIRIVNMGVSSNTVRDLAARWPNDGVALHPGWLSIMIGINDVWRQFDTRLKIEVHIGLNEYARTLETLIHTTQPQPKGLVLMTPYFIEPNRADTMQAKMDWNVQSPG